MHEVILGILSLIDFISSFGRREGSGGGQEISCFTTLEDTFPELEIVVSED